MRRCERCSQVYICCWGGVMESRRSCSRTPQPRPIANASTAVLVSTRQPPQPRVFSSSYWCELLLWTGFRRLGSVVMSTAVEDKIVGCRSRCVEIKPIDSTNSAPAADIYIYMRSRLTPFLRCLFLTSMLGLGLLLTRVSC